jgi:hypothetical protein
VFFNSGVPVQVLGQFLGDKMIANVHFLVQNPKIEIITGTEFGVGNYQVIPLPADHDPDRSAARLERILFDSIFFHGFKSLREPLTEDLVEPRQAFARQLAVCLGFLADFVEYINFRFIVHIEDAF